MLRLLSLVFFILPVHLYGQTTFRWVPTSDDLASNPANWRQQDCAGPSGILPGIADSIVFDHCSGNAAHCVIDIPLNVQRLLLDTSFTGVVTMQPGISLSCEELIVRAGQFLGNSGDISVNRSLRLSGGYLLASSATTTVSGQLILEAGSFDHNHGTVLIKKGPAGTARIIGNTTTAPTMAMHRLVFFPSGVAGTTFEIDHITLQILEQVEFAATKPLTLKTNGGGLLEIHGDLISNNPTLNTDTLRFRFAGSNMQTVTGTTPPALYKIEVNKSDGFVRLETRLIVKNELVFLQGFIHADSAYAVTFLENASVSGASGKGFVRGAVRKVGNVEFVFPIGAGWLYRPLKISPPSLATDEFLAFYRWEAPPWGTASDTSLTYVSQCEYWALYRLSGNANVLVRLFYDSLTCDIDTLISLRIGRWHAATQKWISIGKTHLSGTLKMGSIVSATKQDQFGYFALAKRSVDLFVDAGPNRVVCQGSRVQLGGFPTAWEGFPPYTFQWTPALYLDSAEASNPTITAYHDISYVLKVTDKDDRIVFDTVHIKVETAPRAAAGPDRLVAPGGTVELGAPVYGGKPPFVFSWQPATFLDNPSSARPKATPLAHQTYTVTVTDVRGCVGTDEVSVRIVPPDLGRAGAFALLAADTLRSGSTILVSGAVGSAQFVSSTVRSTDTIVIRSAYDSLALQDLEAAVAMIQSLPTVPLSGNLDGQVLSAGIYAITTKATLNSTLTLSGDHNALFVFHLHDSLVVSNGASIALQGVTRQQVYFYVSKGIRIQGTAVLPAVFIVENSFVGGSVEHATVLSKGRIIVHGGTFSPACVFAKRTTLSRTDLADWFGVNSSTVEIASGSYPSHWSYVKLRQLLPLLNLRIFRYPPGGDSKNWNANDGWFFDAMEKYDAAGATYDERLLCTGTQFVDLRTRDKLPLNRWLEFKHVLTANDASAMYVANMFTDIQFQKDIIRHALDLGARIKYVELGNEFYLRGQTCAFRRPVDYANVVNDYLNMIHGTAGFEQLRVGIVASAFQAEENLDNENGCRRFSWNAELMPLVTGTQPGDALTFHLYPGTGIPPSKAPNVDLQDVPIMLIKAYEESHAFHYGELALLNQYPDLDAWITEYNLTDPSFKIHGSWAHALYLSLFTLRLAEMAKVKLVTCQTMANDAARGLLFIDHEGYRLPTGWQTIDEKLITQPGGLTAGGLAIKQIADAMRFCTLATKLHFPNGPTLVGSNYPGLYGWSFDKDLGDKQSILLNLTGQGHYVQINDLAPFSAMEQIYAANPLLFVTGHVYHHAPESGWYNAVHYDYASNTWTPARYDSLHVRIPEGVTTIYLPPYSITRLYVLNTAGVWLRQSGNAVCAPDPDGVVPTQASTAANLYASGGALYEWTLANTVCRQQNNVGSSPVMPATGSLKVYDPEGKLIAEKNNITITHLPLPSVTVTPSSFDNTIAKASEFTASASGAIAYNWSPSRGVSSIVGQTVVIRPYQSQRYAVVGIGANQCAKNAWLPTTMHPAVTLMDFDGTFITDQFPAKLRICKDTSVTMFAATQADQIRWLLPDGTELATGPTFTLTASENQLVIVEATDRSIPATTLTPFWVEVLPMVEWEQADVFGCANSFIRINATMSQDDATSEYAWNDLVPGNYLYEKKNFNKPVAEQVFSTSYDPVFFHGPAGTYSISVQGRNANYLTCPGTVNGFTGTVYVSDTASLAIPYTPCVIQGGNVSLEALSPNGTLTWIGPALHQSTGSIVNVSPTETATYTVVAANDQCCVSKSFQVQVISFTAQCDGSSYCYGCQSKTVSVSPYDPLVYTYQWYENDQPIAGATQGFYIVSLASNESLKQTTVYCAIEKKDGSCAPGRTNSVRITLVQNCHYSRLLPEKDPVVDFAHMTIFPNPTQQGFTVHLEAPNSLQGAATLTLFHMMGHAVWHQVVDLTSAMQVKADIPLHEGSYLLRFCADNQCITRKLVVIP